jgi:hypothetical protein
VHHDDIVHKIDATGFMIFVPTYFYVLTPAFTSVHMLHIPLYMLTTVCTVHTKKSEVQPVRIVICTFIFTSDHML